MVSKRGCITVDKPSDRLLTVLPAIWRHPDSPVPIRVLALWATDYDSRCLLTTWRALDIWQDWLLDGPALLLGDFNQSVFWDKSEQPLQFRDVTNRLREMGFRSAYHVARSCDFGSEDHMSLRWRQSAFHVDYVFFSQHFEVIACQLCETDLSDHSAVVADLVED